MLDEAIQAYSSVLLIDRNNRDLNLKRGSVNLAKGEIEKAVVDYQLGGKPLPLPVTADSAKLQFGSKVSATVKRGQTLSITKLTQLNGQDWLFVAAVDGNDAARGWIRKTAVLGKVAEAAVSEPITSMDSMQPFESGQFSEKGSSRYSPRSPLQRLMEQGRQQQFGRQRWLPQRYSGRRR